MGTFEGCTFNDNGVDIVKNNEAHKFFKCPCGSATLELSTNEITVLGSIKCSNCGSPITLSKILESEK